jgi:hypothetical protein
MKLVTLLKEILEEDDEEITAEYPKHNLNISFFEKEKKIHFAPLQGVSSSKTRTIINQVKDNFKVISVRQLPHGVFELKLDPTQQFFSVVDFIKTELGVESI